VPRYEFFCRNCKKLFSRILSLVDYEEGDILCTHGKSATQMSALWLYDYSPPLPTTNPRGRL
jgi:hypothetical protein